MTKSINNSELISELQKRGCYRKQVTMAFDMTDAVVAVAERSASIFKRMLPMRPERGR